MLKRNIKITTYLIIVIAVIITVQFSLLMQGFICGGIMSGIRKNAYRTFDKSVHSRVTYLQTEINERWTSINPYVEHISQKLSGNSVNEDFFLSIEQDMLAMMRDVEVTDCYVIMDNQGNGDMYPALYFRNGDVRQAQSGQRPIRLLAGPTQMTERYERAEDWQGTYVKIAAADSDFYDVPFRYRDVAGDSDNGGYWSGPFSLGDKDEPRIAYSLPLVDKVGITRGVIGIGVSSSFVNQYLPVNDISKTDNLGYIIARKENEVFLPIISREENQKDVLNLDGGLDMTLVDAEEHIYLIDNSVGDNAVYGCVEELGLYSEESLFPGEKWYLIGLQKEENLLALEIQIQRMLFGILLITMFLSLGIGSIGFYKLARPIVELAKTVSSFKLTEEITLKRTGFYELDRLEEAIETEHKNYMDAQGKISEVVDLVNIPIGVFCYKKDVSEIMTTTKLPLILGFSEEEKEGLLQDRDKFLLRLHEIMENEDADHRGIYKISGEPERWIKINIVEQEKEILGIVIDITEEQQETAKLRQERNYDVLTGLYSRRYFRDCVKHLLEEDDLGVCAGVMFDLDEFKQINDAYGHAFGDRYLREAARYLRDISSTGCIVGRRSGDEFYAFLYDFESREEIRKTINDFYRKLRDCPMLFPDRTNQILEVSAGIAWYNSETMDFDSLLEHADRALYQAKENYKGYFVDLE